MDTPLGRPNIKISRKGSRASFISARVCSDWEAGGPELPLLASPFPENERVRIYLLRTAPTKGVRAVAEDADDLPTLYSDFGVDNAGIMH